MKEQLLNSESITRNISTLARYGFDSFSTILSKLERLVMEAGLTEEEALEALQKHYEELEKTNKV